MKNSEAAYAGIRSIARNAIFLTSMHAVKIITRTVYVVVVARLLGPEIYALLAYSQAWYLTFLPLAVFGLGPVVIRSIARQPEDADSIAANAAAIQIIMTCIATIICVGSAWVIAPNEDAPELIAVLGFALIARSAYLWAQDLFIAFEQTQHLLRMEITFRIFEVLVAATILFSGGGILLLVALHALVWLLQALYALRMIIRQRFVRVNIAGTTKEWLPLMAAALPFFISTLTIVWRAQGPIILYGNILTDSASFGRFALTLQLLLIAAILPQSLAVAAQPVVTRSAQRDDGKDLIYARTVVRGAFLFGTSVSLCGLTAGPWLMATLFGDVFSMVGESIGLMLLILIPIAAGCAYPVVIIARGHLHLQMGAAVIGAVAMTTLMPALEPQFGEAGVIAAIAAGYVAPWIITSAFVLSKGWDNPFLVSLRPAALSSLAFLLYFLVAPYSEWLALPLALVTLALGSLVLGIITKKASRFLLSFLRNQSS